MSKLPFSLSHSLPQSHNLHPDSKDQIHDMIANPDSVTSQSILLLSVSRTGSEIGSRDVVPSPLLGHHRDRPT